MRVRCPKCGEDVKGTAYKDSDGDINVIGGVRYFTSVEDVEHPPFDPQVADEPCDVTDEELAEALSEAYYDYRPEDDPQFPW